MAEGRRGAPRSETARRAILDATVALFTTRGYDHLTIEGIAAQAGVGKQTIYRWWPSKGALVLECLLGGLLLPGAFDPPDTGDLRADLTTWLDDLLSFVGRPDNATLVTSLAAAAAENEDVGVRLHEALGAASPLFARFDSAIASGDLRADAPVREIADALVGAVILVIIRRAPRDAGRARRLVDAVLH
jgi:AcrR family transcriptional regulator